MKIKKLSVIALTVLSAATVAIGFSGCKASGFLSENGYIIPKSITLNNVRFGYIKEIEDRVTVRKIYTEFNSADYEIYDITDITDITTIMDGFCGGILVTLCYKDASLNIFVDFSGQAACEIAGTYYRTEPEAINYDLLDSYIKH